MLSDDEIRRRLQIVRYSSASERCARRGVTMWGLAKAAGLARERLHRICNGEPFGPKYRQSLSRVLTCDKVTGVRALVHTK